MNRKEILKVNSPSYRDKLPIKMLNNPHKKDNSIFRNNQTAEALSHLNTANPKNLNKYNPQPPNLLTSLTMNLPRTTHQVKDQWEGDPQKNQRNISLAIRNSNSANMLKNKVRIRK